MPMKEECGCTYLRGTSPETAAYIRGLQRAVEIANELSLPYVTQVQMTLAVIVDAIEKEIQEAQG